LQIALTRIALAIAATIALAAPLAVPASAQRTREKQDQPEAKQNIAEQRKKAKEAEEASKAAMDKLPEKKPADPWKNMR
jgi:Ni/Co efflux regulator RcnB